VFDGKTVVCQIFVFSNDHYKYLRKFNMITKRAFSTLFSLIVASVATFAYADAPIVQVNLDLTDNGLDRYSFSVDADGTEYDTIEIIIDGIVNQTENGAGTIFTPNSEDTDFLGLPTVALGGSVATSTDTESGFSGVVGFTAPDLVSDRLGAGTDFFQAVIPNGGTAAYQVNFLRSGSFIDSFGAEGTLVIPEPTSLVLAGFGLISFIGIRRRTT